MATTVTITETPVEVTVQETAITADITESDTTVSIVTGNHDHGGLVGLGDDDHTQYAQKANDLSDLNSAATARSNLGLVSGGDGDIWVEKAGDTMTAALTLSGDPTNALHAATKQYVDNAAGAGDVDDLTTDTGSTGEMLRVDSLGTGLEYRTPAQVLADIGAVDVTGDTMTGSLSFNGVEVFLQDDGSDFLMLVGAVNPSLFIGGGGNTSLSGVLNTVISIDGGGNLTSGARNMLVGRGAGLSLTEGNENMLIGYRAGFNLTTGSANIGIGTDTLLDLETSSHNVGIGFNALGNTAAGVTGNAGIGSWALRDTTGDYNTGIGYQAGMFSDGDKNIFIGPEAGESVSASNKLYVAISNTDNPLIYGDFAAGLLTVHTEDAVTAAIVNTLTLNHLTSGTPAAGYGTALRMQLESSTTEDRNAARIAAEWNVATDASREADLVLSAYEQATEREGLRIRGSGSGAQIGFLGATPISRQAHIADADGTLADITSKFNTLLGYLESFGFIATS